MDSDNPGSPFCLSHEDIKRKIEKVEDRQATRQCDFHTEKLKSLERSVEAQWKAINSLRTLVYMGAGAAGVLAFVGSILGALVRRF